MRQLRQGALSTLLACAVSAYFQGQVAAATTYFISPTGNDTNNGLSNTTPFKTPGKAAGLANPGDMIYVMDGTYNLGSVVNITRSGNAANPIQMLPLPGPTPIFPIFDFTTEGNGARGLQLNGNYWNISGLTIQKAHDNGINVNGSNNVLDRLVLRQNQDSGIQIGNSDGSFLPANNLVVNTDSYLNYDPANHGENADGFAVKWRNMGSGNILRDTRAWNNSDDGYDFWGAGNGVTVENAWAYKNGINFWGDTSFNGDGNGIKLGHDSGTHILKNMVIWQNVVHGIDVNGNATVDTNVDKQPPYSPIAHGVQVYNTTAYDNGGSNYVFDEFVSQYPHALKNNVALNTLGSGHNNTFQSGNTYQNNSWNGAAFEVDSGDFLSLDDTIAIGARQADGSLPISDFLRLVAGSNLIDVGLNVGIPYNGSAPDLGAFEFVPTLASDGDFDDDGDRDAADIDILWHIVRQTGADPNNNDTADLNGDTFANEDDVDLILASKLTAGTNRAYGDANLSGGAPELTDYNLWRTGTGGWAGGDFDGSGGVPELNDYNLWRTGPTQFPDTVGSHGGPGFGASAQPSGAPGAAPGGGLVPEPATWILLVSGIGLMLVQRRGKQ